MEREDWNRALEMQAQLVGLGQRSPELFYNTGLLLQKTGQLDDAIRLYREALVDRPDFAEAMLNLGHALDKKGQSVEAREYWREAIKCKPELAGQAA